MSNNSISVVCGDNKTELSFTLKDSANAVVNITGFTIRFAIRKQGAVANTNNANNTCTLVSPTLGVFKYSFVSTDLPSSGTYLGQLIITFTDSKIHKVPVFLKIQAIESYV